MKRKLSILLLIVLVLGTIIGDSNFLAKAETIKSYKITYENEGQILTTINTTEGSDIPNVNAYDYLSTDYLTHEKLGYKFVGWSDPFNGGGVTGDATVTAIWELEPLEISFYLNKDMSVEEMLKIFNNTNSPSAFHDFIKNYESYGFKKESYFITYTSDEERSTKINNLQNQVRSDYGQGDRLTGYYAIPCGIENSEFLVAYTDYHYFIYDIYVDGVLTDYKTVNTSGEKMYGLEETQRSMTNLLDGNYFGGVGLEVFAENNNYVYDKCVIDEPLSQWINDGTVHHIALYLNKPKSQFTVNFYSDNVLLKTQLVNKNESATAPEGFTKIGYHFANWDTDFSNVTKDLNVNAKWQPNQYIVAFMSDDVLIDYQVVNYGDRKSVV